MIQRAQALADRIEQGADALAAFARTLSPAEWKMPVPKDGRTIGVIVHHVANVYPLEVQLAQTLAAGKPIAGVTWDAVHEMNAQPCAGARGGRKGRGVGSSSTQQPGGRRGRANDSDEALDRAAPVSLNADAPLTCQFFVEDHALRHSFHHLARIRAALGR